MSTRELKNTLLCEKSGYFGLFEDFNIIYTSVNPTMTGRTAETNRVGGGRDKRERGRKSGEGGEGEQKKVQTIEQRTERTNEPTNQPTNQRTNEPHAHAQINVRVFSEHITETVY